jgi:hypothetical protein
MLRVGPPTGPCQQKRPAVTSAQLASPNLANPVVVLDLEKANTMTRSEVRNYIDQLEATLSGFNKVEIKPKHHFSHELYGREIEIKAGILLVGRIHRFQCLNILLKGEVTVLSVDGVMRVKAPHVFVSKPGAKRVILAHEDSTWMTAHATKETDPDQMEELLTASSYEELNALEEQCLS